MVYSGGPQALRSSTTVPLVDIRGLYKSYGKASAPVDVLRGVDLAMERGSSMAVLGASGAGKSTLLNLMGALDRPTKGEIFYDGEPLFGLDDRGLARFRNRKIGFVFQFHHLLPEFTAIENVMLPALIGGEPAPRARERAAGLLNDVGLGSRLEHKPGELSGGEQQRVAIMRAVMQSPELILADEPTGNLDRKTGAEVFDLLLAMNREKGLTIVVVTHNEQLAARAARRVRIEDGTAQEI
jgi:lipoprotein-releasing system ATP-binding protein